MAAHSLPIRPGVPILADGSAHRWALGRSSDQTMSFLHDWHRSVGLAVPGFWPRRQAISALRRVRQTTVSGPTTLGITAVRSRSRGTHPAASQLTDRPDASHPHLPARRSSSRRTPRHREVPEHLASGDLPFRVCHLRGVDALRRFCGGHHRSSLQSISFGSTIGRCRCGARCFLSGRYRCRTRVGTHRPSRPRWSPGDVAEGGESARSPPGVRARCVV
jgi:hypothetical protein